MVLKAKPKLNLKFMLKGSKTKIMKGSKNKRGLTQVKAIFFEYKRTKELIYYDNKEILAKKYCF